VLSHNFRHTGYKRRMPAGDHHDEAPGHRKASHAAHR
jgi:hypothetical protein